MCALLESVSALPETMFASKRISAQSPKSEVIYALRKDTHCICVCVYMCVYVYESRLVYGTDVIARAGQQGCQAGHGSAAAAVATHCDQNPHHDTAEVRSQKSKIGIRKSEVGSRKPEVDGLLSTHPMPTSQRRNLVLDACQWAHLRHCVPI